MVGDMRWFSRIASEVMNSKLHTTLRPPVRSYEKEKRIVPISVSSKILFLQAIIKTPLQIISGSSIQGDVLFPVLADNCVVFLVNVYVVFIAHGGLTLITIKNKQTTLPLRILEQEHLSVLSYATPILVRKSVLIIWPWDCYQLTGLISNFFRNFIKISQFLSHFGVFITNKEEGVPHCSQNLMKEKKLLIKPPGMHAQGIIYYAMPILLCFCDILLHF